MIGWEKHVIEPAAGIVIPAASGGIRTGWVTVDRWTKAEAEALKLFGPSKLYGHVGWEMANLTSKPTRFTQRWLRENSSDGETQRHDHLIPLDDKQNSDGFEGPEYLSLEDFPLAFQVRQAAGIVTVRKVITVIDAPYSGIAEKIAP